ncbi:MAG: undecaprenyl/decaprenyl-phosphate alpha-N-acetylglucosaminyl 1-phosphate transferase [Phycisphaerae bacterium]|nr:undecaprenyl/decaprenyl-phosphate alpha-N-acetylglucosaminyl 1-phosphate transferase [Phycisphaerae bacterium]
MIDALEEYFVTLPFRDLMVIAGGGTFLVALFTGVLLTLVTRKVCWIFNIVDKPDGHLKCHKRATATLGGIPLFGSIMIAIIFVLWILHHGIAVDIRSGFKHDLFKVSFLVASAIILILGITDDIWQVSPRRKMVFQVIAALILTSSGLVVHACDFFNSFDIHLGIMAIPFTLFWLVGSCNAFNFIDGMDGLASGIGMIIALVLAVLACLNGVWFEAIVATALAGGLLAILLFNFRPASIFLGDSGSQLIGLILGVLAIKIATINGALALPCAGLILSVPILDTLLSIFRRYSSSDSPARGDHKHIHHCLLERGFSVAQADCILWAAVLVTGAYGVVFCFSNTVVSGLSALTLVVLELYIGIRLGCLDVRQLLVRLQGSSSEAAESSGQAVGQDIAELETLWDRMKPLFEQMHLDRVVLTLEGISDDGQPNYETYRWCRSGELLAELFSNRWTKRFALGDDQLRIATLQLESEKKLNRDEQRIEWLLGQLRNNMLKANLDNSRHEEALKVG